MPRACPRPRSGVHYRGLAKNAGRLAAAVRAGQPADVGGTGGEMRGQWALRRSCGRNEATGSPPEAIINRLAAGEQRPCHRSRLNAPSSSTSQVETALFRISLIPMNDSRHERRVKARRNSGCFGVPVSGIWLFFTLMYFFTEADALPIGKWEFVWRFFAGPFNFAF